MTKIYPTQCVCTHRLMESFKMTIGGIGAIYEVDCSLDNLCPNQPERSKREDKCKEDIDDRHDCVWGSSCRDINHGCGKHSIRCSEHCGNTVREAQ